MSIQAASLLASAAPANETRKRELGQADFLRLLTEQLKNQDPLKPLASNEFLGQLAQFSSVQGIQSLNASFSALAAAVEGDQALKAAALVGQTVRVESENFELGAEGSIAGAVEVPMAGRVTLEILDASGAVVHRMETEAHGPGSHEFEWDGRGADGARLPPGAYRIAARVSAGARTEALTPLLDARVDSVSLTQSGLLLNLAGVGPVPLSAVQRIGASPS